MIEQLLTELPAQATDSVIAYRQGARWVQRFDSVELDHERNNKRDNERENERHDEINDQSDASHLARPALRQGGVYLITGGLGEMAGV